MTKGRAPAFLYSGDNVTLWHKLQQECGNNEISISKVSDLSDFFIKRKSLGLVILFIDQSTVSPSAELIQFMQKCSEGWQSLIVVFLGEAEAKLTKQYCNVLSVSPDAVDGTFMQMVLGRVEVEMMRLAGVCNCKVSASKISRFLMDFEFAPKYLGWSYLVEAIEYIVLNGGVVGNLQSKAYSYVASRFFTKVASIERNIRMAIENAYKNNPEKFGGKKPSNKAFIAFAVNKLKYSD